LAANAAGHEAPARRPQRSAVWLAVAFVGVVVGLIVVQPVWVLAGWVIGGGAAAVLVAVRTRCGR